MISCYRPGLSAGPIELGEHFEADSKSGPLIWERFNEPLNYILWASEKHRILEIRVVIYHLDQMEPKLLHRPPHSTNRLALPPTSLHQSFRFPTQIIPPIILLSRPNRSTIHWDLADEFSLQIHMR
jgi:hypothetical protein